ncbi:MAG: DUF6786 family protein [Bacteroidota bacterium]
MKFKFALIGIVAGMAGCGKTASENSTTSDSPVSFQSDVDFLKKYTDIIILSDPAGKEKVAVSAALQGRVMDEALPME